MSRSHSSSEDSGRGSPKVPSVLESQDTNAERKKRKSAKKSELETAEDEETLIAATAGPPGGTEAASKRKKKSRRLETVDEVDISSDSPVSRPDSVSPAVPNLKLGKIDAANSSVTGHGSSSPSLPSPKVSKSDSLNSGMQEDGDVALKSPRNKQVGETSTPIKSARSHKTKAKIDSTISSASYTDTCTIPAISQTDTNDMQSADPGSTPLSPSSPRKSKSAGLNKSTPPSSSPVPKKPFPLTKSIDASEGTSSSASSSSPTTQHPRKRNIQSPQLSTSKNAASGHLDSDTDSDNGTGSSDLSTDSDPDVGTSSSANSTSSPAPARAKRTFIPDQTKKKKRARRHSASQKSSTPSDTQSSLTVPSDADFSSSSSNNTPPLRTKARGEASLTKIQAGLVSSASPRRASSPDQDPVPSPALSSTIQSSSTEKPASAPKLVSSKSKGSIFTSSQSTTPIVHSKKSRSFDAGLPSSSSLASTIAASSGGMPQPYPFGSTATSPAPDPAAASRQRTASLLLDVLRSPTHVEMLHSHMKKDMCDENLDFWLDVERLKHRLHLLLLQSPGNLPFLDTHTILEEARPIFDTYIESGATRSLNIPSRIAAKLKHAFKAKEPSFPITEALFADAQESVFKVMEADPFPRYLTSLGPAATDGLVQLGPGTMSQDFDELLEAVNDYSASTSKWTKVYSEDGIRLHKYESHGVMNVAVSVELNCSVLEASSFVSRIDQWGSWHRPGATIIELERISESQTVNYMTLIPTSKHADSKHHDAVLLLGWRLDPQQSIIVFKTVPFSTAPSPPNTIRVTVLLSGWRVVPSDSAGISHVIHYFRAPKSESKKWDKEFNIHMNAIALLKTRLNRG